MNRWCFTGGGNTPSSVGQKALDWQLRMLVCPLLPVLHHRPPPGQLLGVPGKYAGELPRQGRPSGFMESQLDF